MSQIPPAPALKTGVTKIDPIKDESSVPDKTQILNALVGFYLKIKLLHIKIQKHNLN